MKEHLNMPMVPIAEGDFIRGSIQRKKYRGTNRQYLYHYKDLRADFLNDSRFIRDTYMEALVAEGAMAPSMLRAYYQDLEPMLALAMEEDDLTEEELYGRILDHRGLFVGDKSEAYDEALRTAAMSGKAPVTMGINQSALLWQKLQGVKNVVIFLEEVTYLDGFTRCYERLRDMPLDIRVVVKAQRRHPLDATAADMAELVAAEAIRVSEDKGVGYDLRAYKVPEESLVLGFGEWFVGAFRNLNVDAFVFCTSEEIVTRDATNAGDKKEQHCIYVPRGYNMTEQLSITEVAVANYRILERIYGEIGEAVYDLSIDQLLKAFPNDFINGKSDRILEGIPMAYGGNFYEDRLHSLFCYAKSRFDGVFWQEKTFKDRAGNPMRAVTVAVEEGLLGHLDVHCFEEATSVRQYYRSQPGKNGIVANFMFFSTDKSLAAYNDLRQDRREEQCHKVGWHLDYRYDGHLCVPPLYNKASLALSKEGTLSFEKKALKQGVFTIDGVDFALSGEDINVTDETARTRPIIVYTPLHCQKDTAAFHTTKALVGHGRVNFILVNGALLTVRQGEVLQPNMGVVLSLQQEMFDHHFHKAYGALFSDRGYLTKLPTCFYQDKALEDTVWAYGGGMFLIEAGRAYDDAASLMAEFQREGWRTDLSKQTQGSLTFKNDKHPRTVIGKTGGGRMFITVVTGRSRHSVGANYLELIEINKAFYEDITDLMNLDGGASSFLGLVLDGEVIPLTDITYTDDSAAGEIRPLNSIIEINLA